MDSGFSPSEAELERHAVELERRAERLKCRPDELERWSKIAGAWAAVFTAITAGGHFGHLPAAVAVTAGGFLLAGVVAALAFLLGANRAGQRAQIAQRDAEFARRAASQAAALLVPVGEIGAIDPIRIGVDRAAEQTVLPGNNEPAYLPRNADQGVRDEINKALQGRSEWIVVVAGEPKVGKSRTLFEAIKHCTHGRSSVLVAPRDGDGLRYLLTPNGLPEGTPAMSILWLDDLEDFIDQGVTLDTLRAWRDRVPGGIIAATYGGKGSTNVERSGKLSSIANKVLGAAVVIPLEQTTPDELGWLRSAVSSEVLAEIERYGLAAYLVAAGLLKTKFVTGRHDVGAEPCREGKALVNAAVDWARCGRSDPIARATLRDLWQSYLPTGMQPNLDLSRC